MSPLRSRADADVFAGVRELGLAMPEVETATKNDGSPLLKRGGSFMAGLAMHRSTEPDTLVVRARLEERESMIEDAPKPTTSPTTTKSIPSSWCGWRASIATRCATCSWCRGG